MCRGHPIVGPDGTIYVTSWYAAPLYAVRPDGTIRWVLNLGPVAGVMSDGTLVRSLGCLCACWTTPVASIGLLLCQRRESQRFSNCSAFLRVAGREFLICFFTNRSTGAGLLTR